MKELLRGYRLGLTQLAVALAALVAFAFWATTPASATTDPVTDWFANDGTEVVWDTDEPHGPVLSMSQGNAVGTSLEKVFGGIPLEKDIVLKFEYKLIGEGKCGGGAPRVFISSGELYGQIANCPNAGEWTEVSLTESPDVHWWKGSVKYDSWDQAYEANSELNLGLVGLVFDNDAGNEHAAILFRNLTLFGDRLELNLPSPDPTSTPTANPTGTPTGQPTADPTEDPDPNPSVSGTPRPTQTTAQPTETPSGDPGTQNPGTGGSDDSGTDGGLALTGSTPTAFYLGGILLSVGLAMLVGLWVYRARTRDPIQQ